MHDFLISGPYATAPAGLLTTQDKLLIKLHVKIDIPILILASYSI